MRLSARKTRSLLAIDAYWVVCGGGKGQDGIRGEWRASKFAGKDSERLGDKALSVLRPSPLPIPDNKSFTVMADSETQKLIHEAESALHRASEAVEDTLAGTKASLRKADKKLTQETGVLQGGLERVLGGKSLFWVEEPVDGRRLANNMVGWGAFGLAVHAWHRGIQRVPVLSPRE